ncbi:MAG TPA: DinB family protein [Mycobacteriales bacterium]|jgi:hypothetical protein|nr:DinB family protein [Mycobacteriales bacterium]
MPSNVDEHGRPHPPLAAGETEMLLGFLEFQRATFAWKCAGLDAAGLRVTVGVSPMTLGGMLKHLAVVEDYWCVLQLHDRRMPEQWRGVDWEHDPDWPWRSAAADSPETLRALWRESVERSRALVAEALADGGLDRPAALADEYFRTPPTLRWILCHLIEEYARHNGHADLLREAADGETGE